MRSRCGCGGFMVAVVTTRRGAQCRPKPSTYCRSMVDPFRGVERPEECQYQDRGHRRGFAQGPSGCVRRGARLMERRSSSAWTVMSTVLGLRNGWGGYHAELQELRRSRRSHEDHGGRGAMPQSRRSNQSTFESALQVLKPAELCPAWASIRVI